MIRRIILFLAVILSSFHVQAAPNQNPVDSLIDVLTNTQGDTTHVLALNRLAFLLRNTDADSALHCAERALVLSKKLNWEAGMSKSFHILGIFNFRMGNPLLALDYYGKALVINQRMDQQEGIAENLGNMGVAYRGLGNYPMALEYYFKALKINRELIGTDDENMAGIPRTLGNIGLVYWNQGDLEQALKYFFEALEMDKELGRNRGIASNYGNIGLVYNEQGDDIKALEYYLKALDLDEELGFTPGVATHLGNIGVLYDKRGEYEKALEYYSRAQEKCDEIGDKNSSCINLLNIGGLYILQEKYIEAEKTLLESLKSANEMEALNLLRQAEHQLSILYERTGDYQKSYEHYVLYSLAKDSLFNEQKSKELGKLEAKYEFETAEEERKRAEAEANKLASDQESRRNNLQYSGILIFIVLVFALVFALGRVSIPIRLAEGLIFFSFLLIFEFTLVLLDPYIEIYSSGAPAIKLAFNAVLAALIFPLHSLFETKLKDRLVK